MTSRPPPHVCDYVDPDGTTSGTCHLRPPHGGRCARGCRVALTADGTVTTAATADDCAHQAEWETMLLCPHLDCAVHR